VSDVGILLVTISKVILRACGDVHMYIHMYEIVRVSLDIHL